MKSSLKIPAANAETPYLARSTSNGCIVLIVSISVDKDMGTGLVVYSTNPSYPVGYKGSWYVSELIPCLRGVEVTLTQE